MKRVVQLIRHPMQAVHYRDSRVTVRTAPVERSGWPPLTVTVGVHRRADDEVPWHPDGPADPWNRSAPYTWPWR